MVRREKPRTMRVEMAGSVLMTFAGVATLSWIRR
jgi:hypothetical protein